MRKNYSLKTRKPGFQIVNGGGNCKGFTLIELLAVIVILAVIAVVATPIIIGVIDDARKSAFKNTAYGIIEAANFYYAQNMLKGETQALTTFTVSENKLKSGNQELAFTGKVPVGDSWVKVNEEGRVSLRITDGKYYVSKDYDETGVMLANNEEEALTREELALELAELRNIVNSNSTAIENNNTSLVASMTDLQTTVNTNNTILTNSVSGINSSISNIQATMNDHATSINNINARTNIKTYTELTQLGLSNGCSLTDIITTMPNGSIALLNQSSTVDITDMPLNASSNFINGTLIIYRYSKSRVLANFYAVGGYNGFYYRIYYNNTFLNDWTQLN